MSISWEFAGACETIDLLRCDSSLYYLDPCDCRRSFRCVNGEIVTTTCIETLLWDPKTNNCAYRETIWRDNNCTLPWTRCNVTESRLLQLESICTNTTVTTPLPSSTPGKSEKQDGGGVNAGLVVGLIVAGALLALLVITAAFFYWRHRKKSTIRKGRGTIASNPEYFEGGNENDPYDFINDTHMTDPTYQGESVGFPSNGTLSTSIRTDTLGGTAVYDNSASRDTGTSGSSGYTDTLAANQRERETPYERLARDRNANEIEATSGEANQVHENRGFTDDDDGATPSAGNEEAHGTSNSSTQDDNKPDYFILTREGT